MPPMVGSGVRLLASFAALGLLPITLAHGDDMDMSMGAEAPPADPGAYPPTYFALQEHTATIYAHVALMIVAWVFMLPPAVMLSIARSRYALAVQFAFLATNAAGVLLGTIYNANTPDLYPNNAHHKLGWIVTCVVSAQVVVGLMGKLAGALKSQGGFLRGGREQQLFIPVSHEAMAEHQRLNKPGTAHDYRRSHDSGQGTEPNTESLRSHSVSSGFQSPPLPRGQANKEYEDDDDDYEDLEMDIPATPKENKPRAILRQVANKLSSRSWKALVFAYNFIDRTILILGFIALCTGIITFGRFFEGHQIFTGLAHWIKGGIFFWLGLFTLGRWSGSFGDLGWAWNIRPKHQKQRWSPSAEFVESALIFTYGATNIFLEHLGGADDGYSAEDLEHVSITVLFIGGGLCGMLIESVHIRDLLNMTVTEAAHSHPDNEGQEVMQQPRQYSFSMNPIPALVILLLGIMMGSHQQESMISSMVHKQWGNLLSGASLARGLTYLLMWLKPPRSIYPSRPPTELLASFGLIAGGIMFMASSGDTVDGMIHYNLDAMFMYTVTLGFVGLIMAWVVIVIAIKGWAVRKEAGRPKGMRGPAYSA